MGNSTCQNVDINSNNDNKWYLTIIINKIKQKDKRKGNFAKQLKNWTSRIFIYLFCYDEPSIIVIGLSEAFKDAFLYFNSLDNSEK